MKMLIKHQALAILLMLTLGMPAAVGDPLKKVSILLDWYPEAENAGYYYALIHGFYKAAGLDVQISPIGPGATVEPQVAVGRFDFGIGSSDSVMIARSRGIPLVTVMGSMQHDPVGVMMHESSPVHSLADLGGQTVAAPPGAPWLLYVINKYHLKNVNVVPLSTNYAPFLHNPNYIQQVFVTSEPPIMENKGVHVRTIWIKESGCDAYLALESSNAFISAHPDIVRSFIAASIAGWNGYMADPATTDAEIMRRNPEMDQTQLTLSREAMAKAHLIDGDDGHSTGQLDPKRLANQYKILRDLGIIAADYDLTQAYTTEFLPAKSSGPPPAPKN